MQAKTFVLEDVHFRSISVLSEQTSGRNNLNVHPVELRHDRLLQAGGGVVYSQQKEAGL